MTYLPAPDINLQEIDRYGHGPLLQSNCIYFTYIEICTSSNPVKFDETGNGRMHKLAVFMVHKTASAFDIFTYIYRIASFPFWLNNDSIILP